MHCAASRALHAVSAWTDARMAHETFVSTLHVAPHDALHWLSHDDCVSDLHWSPHWFAHWLLQYVVHSLGTRAAAQTTAQLSPHRDWQAELQSALAPASQSMRQCVPHVSAQLPAVPAPQPPSKSAPMVA
jgi:hypothetical protein